MQITNWFTQLPSRALRHSVRSRLTVFDRGVGLQVSIRMTRADGRSCAVRLSAREARELAAKINQGLLHLGEGAGARSWTRALTETEAEHV